MRIARNHKQNEFKTHVILGKLDVLREKTVRPVPFGQISKKDCPELEKRLTPIGKGEEYEVCYGARPGHDKFKDDYLG